MSERVHVMLEYTAKPERFDELREAAREFVDTTLEREPQLSRHEAHVVETSRQFVHLLTFDDALAAREHRQAKHTREFTERFEDAFEGAPSVHELEPVAEP